MIDNTLKNIDGDLLLSKPSYPETLLTIKQLCHVIFELVHEVVAFKLMETLRYGF